MSASNLVIVESPAKAKTINKYLGPDYTVVASFGHVRDLPAKNGSVDPENGFKMLWETGERSKKHLSDILSRAKKVDTVYLATDPDREGEAISWHVQEFLKEKKVADKINIRRVTFNEITKNAVKAAFENAREINGDLVDAYLARRALDYLVGFTLSPVLWRKLPGSRSAGRVQSVALRLVCERETEIEAFNPEEYWSIEAALATQAGKGFTARLYSIDGDRIEKMTLGNKAAADTALARIKGQGFTVGTIEKKQVRRHPYAPFITSTLQQEAARKLRFSATKTMRTAQKLYEGVDIGGETVGLITYMRTDGVTLSGEAIAAARKLIENKFGDKYLPDSPRAYKSKAKNAQEAHEAIRPTDVHRTPESVAKFLTGEELSLYELIWKRTVACQMESAVMDQVAVDIKNSDGKVVLRATGSIVAFDGFLKLYREDMEDKDDSADNDEERRLPPLKEGDALKLDDVTATQHFTQPPPRYTEASLVKKMEELGIGRPSTYASILQVLQDRDYVRLDQRRFIPESRGRIVTTFLMNFFQRYVEYDFTARLEEQLDEISSGDMQWKNVLSDFWTAFSAAIGETKDLTITNVIDALENDLQQYLFQGEFKSRKCPQCEDGKISLKLGKFGAFIGCSNYPDCRFTKPVLTGGGDDQDGSDFAPKELGKHPETHMSVTLRRGPYGPYIQLDPQPQEEQPEPKQEITKTGKPKKAKKPKAPKPKRAPVPKNMSPDDIDLDTALQLLTLPRLVGYHPETGEEIKAGIGRFGPFLVHQKKFKSIPADDPDGVLTIGINRAVDILAQPAKGRGGVTILKEFGPHPDDKKPITLNSGRYGPYVKHDKTNATLPKDMVPETVTLEIALELLAKKKTTPKKKKPAAKKKTTRKKKADKP